jgi:hypothetical protein
MFIILEISLTERLSFKYSFTKKDLLLTFRISGSVSESSIIDSFLLAYCLSGGDTVNTALTSPFRLIPERAVFTNTFEIKYRLRRIQRAPNEAACSFIVLKASL